MIDSHFHIAGDVGLLTHLAQRQAAGIVNSQNSAEWAAIQQWRQNHPAAAITVSAGVHPWDVNRLTPASMRPLLQQAPVIGSDNAYYVTADQFTYEFNVETHSTGTRL